MPDVLKRLRARDPDAALGAKRTTGWLIEEDGDLADVCQLQLCEFLWYAVPYKFLAPLDHHIEIVRATGHLFTEAGMGSHAGLCLSPTTVQILRAWSVDEDDGWSAYQRALAATGLVPPALADFTWGEAMGLEEFSAYYHVSRRIEEAIAAGTARPGTSAWKRRQQGIAAAALSEQSRDGRSWRDVIESERINHWARLGGTAHRELARDIAPRLATPIPLPPDAAAQVEPLRWLLERAGADSGLLLTQKHNLARSVVAAAVLGFPAWAPPWTGRNETDVPELHTTRTWLQSMRALRRRGGRLRITDTGRALLADTASLWRAAAATLTGSDRDVPDGLGRAYGEAELLILTDGKARPLKEIDAAIVEVLREQGWRNALTGEPVTNREVLGAGATLHRHLRVLGLDADDGWGPDATRQLNHSGVAAALTCIRAIAAGPRSQ